MKYKFEGAPLPADYSGHENPFDVDSLLYPAQAFEHPSHVVHDPDLTLNEKRAILASWASDACATEAAPGLRRAPSGRKPVPFDDVIEALRALDKQAQQDGDAAASYRRVLRHGRLLGKRSDPAAGNSGHGQTLN